MAKLLKTRYFWYVSITAFLAGILTHASQVATLIHLPLTGDWQLACYVAAYRLLFLISVAMAAWRFGVKGGLIVCLIVGPAILSVVVADFSTPSVWLDIAVVAIGIMFSWVVGKQGEMKQVLEKTTEEIRRQSTMLESEVTERKRAGEALKRAEREKATILNSLNELLIFQDLNHRMMWTNKAAAESVAMSPQQLVGRYCHEVWGASSEPCQGCPLEKVLQTGQPQASEITTPDGRVWYVRGYPVRDANGDMASVVEVVEDITERKRAEEKLKQSRQRLRDLSAHIESARETERTSIAREVHDELGQALTALKMDLSWMSKRLPEEQEALVKKTKEMSRLIGTTIQTVKRISTELRPGVLDDLGLIAAIEWQVQEFQERTRIKCELTTEGEDINLDRDLATAVFRILQEALINVARHANATRVEVSLNGKVGQLVLQVRDNGKGITEKQISHPKSFGLIGMRERVRSWNGRVKIDGTSGKGTLVIVSIPLTQEEERDDKNTGRR